MKQPRQISQYDKIFRENLEAVLPTLIEKVLGIKVIESEELPDDLQHTKQRHPDVLKKIKDNESAMFILHIEFQLADDDEMIFRMMEYKVMLLRRYQLPVKQFVIYLGNKPSKMTFNYQTNNLSFSYQLLSFREIDYELFLQTNKAEEVVFAILSNFGADTPKTVIEKIIFQLDKTSNGELSFKKHINQLRILAQLRKLNLKIEEIMESILKYINIEDDVLFQKGIEKGIEKGLSLKEIEKNNAFVKNLLLNTDFDNNKIAQLAAVDLAFVDNLANQLGKPAPPH